MMKLTSDIQRRQAQASSPKVSTGVGGLGRHGNRTGIVTTLAQLVTTFGTVIATVTTTDIVMGVTPTRTTIFRYGLVSEPSTH